MSQDSGSTWDAYTNQMTDNGIAFAAILSLDGAVWSSSSLLKSLTKDEIDKLMKQLAASRDNPVFPSFYLAGNKYLYLSWDGAILKLKKMGEGENKYLVSVYKCNTLCIIAGTLGANERGALKPADAIVGYLRDNSY